MVLGPPINENDFWLANCENTVTRFWLWNGAATRSGESFMHHGGCRAKLLGFH